MIKYELLKILEEVLGTSKRTSGDNYAFKTPFTFHHKNKLEINIDITKDSRNKPINKWQCWVTKTSGRSIYSLFKRPEVNASQSEFNRLNDLFSNNNFGIVSNKSVEKIYRTFELPKDFKSLLRNKDVGVDLIRRDAELYLNNRGIFKSDIVRYNMGYCSSGKYKNRIVIPSYDKNWKLNYFITRDFTNSQHIKYMNPSKHGLNIVGFENMINWKLPIVLTEGVFDAIAVRRNAIPLFGKRINSELKYSIFKNGVKKLYVCLDGDAFGDAIDIMKYFLNNGILVYYVDTYGGDPSELGFVEINNRIRNARLINEYDLMSFKLRM